MFHTNNENICEYLQNKYTSCRRKTMFELTCEHCVKELTHKRGLPSYCVILSVYSESWKVNLAYNSAEIKTKDVFFFC